MKKYSDTTAKNSASLVRPYGLMSVRPVSIVCIVSCMSRSQGWRCSLGTIISGAPAQRLRFLAYLDAQETAGMLVYGHHINRESVITCYVEARDIKHIHFVDGSDGGYTAAARELKGKLKPAA